MSRVCPKSGEPVPPTPRGAMTPKRKLELLLAYGGRCSRCKAKITGPGWIANHILPLELGGADELGNLEPLHVACDKPVTSKDLKQIAKMRRQSKMDEPREPSRIQSPGFRRDLKRKMSGQVERRDG